MNSREHWRKRAKRVRMERDSVLLYTYGLASPALPARVRLTRIAPSNGLDDDNLASALKSVRDQVAAWIGVDDRHRDIVRYVYEQERGPWGVTIEILPMAIDPPAA